MPHTATNQVIAMMATAALSQAPIAPGRPPALPPFNGRAGINEAEQHGGRAGHRGDDDEGHRGGNDEDLFDNGPLDDGEFGLDDSIHKGAEELDASAAGYS